jgi:hypothetical protein
MNNDALERLKNKNRPVVQSRDVALDFTSKSTSQDTLVSGLLDNETSGMLGSEVTGMIDSEVSESDVGASLKAQTTQETSNKPTTRQELATKQSTLRLESKLSDRLQALCRESGICREVLIEAMFEYCELNSEALSIVLSEATEKNDYRQEIANRRRAKSMMEKYGG